MTSVPRSCQQKVLYYVDTIRSRRITGSRDHSEYTAIRITLTFPPAFSLPLSLSIFNAVKPRGARIRGVRGLGEGW